MHIGASLQQLIDSLIDAPKTGIPEASILYWVDLSPNVNKVKGYAYTFIVCYRGAAGPLLTVFSKGFTARFCSYLETVCCLGEQMVHRSPTGRLCRAARSSLSGDPICQVLLELAHLGLGLAETAITTGDGHLPEFSPLLILAWADVVVINVGTTLGIAGRLLYIERSTTIGQTRVAGAGTRASRYSAPMFTMIESGTIFTTSTVVLLVLYAVSSPLLQTVVNIATQLAASHSLLRHCRWLTWRKIGHHPSPHYRACRIRTHARL